MSRPIKPGDIPNKGEASQMGGLPNPGFWKGLVVEISSHMSDWFVLSGYYVSMGHCGRTGVVTLVLAETG